MSEPSPKVKLSVGNLTRESIPKIKTTDPRWEENFQFLIHDPQHQDLALEVNILDSSQSVHASIIGCSLTFLALTWSMHIITFVNNVMRQARGFVSKPRAYPRLC